MHCTEKSRQIEFSKSIVLFLFFFSEFMRYLRREEVFQLLTPIMHVTNKKKKLFKIIICNSLILRECLLNSAY